jgi:hypothetical protein
MDLTDQQAAADQAETQVKQETAAGPGGGRRREGDAAGLTILWKLPHPNTWDEEARRIGHPFVGMPSRSSPDREEGKINAS